MILEKINSPQDLKNLSLEDLRTLSAQIRELIVKVVSSRGGHLASSLGAVELCVALHYLLDTPKDSRLLDAPSNYVVVNDSDMLGTTIVENSCIILFDWNTFINKIISVDDQSALKKDFISQLGFLY